MTAKNIYKAGDSAWISGISRNARLTKGTVIKVLDLSDEGFTAGPHYIIAVPTEIDALLEIRTWETMSEDERGPLGYLRKFDLDSTIKFINTVGFETADDFNDPTPEQIHAAIEKSIKDVRHSNLNLKTTSPRRRNFSKKKKT